MKKVTICISFSCKDGVARSAYELLGTLVGWSSAGMRSTLLAKAKFKVVLSLLETVQAITNDFYIEKVTLGERKQVNNLDAGGTKI